MVRDACAPTTRISACMRVSRSCDAMLPNSTCTLLASGRSQLTAYQQLATHKWIKTQPAEQSLLVNIGANSHRKVSRSDPDPSLRCVRLGWRSILVEPVPQNFEALKMTYQSELALQPSRFELIQAALCDGGCATGTMPIWFVDFSNATGNWGTSESDARCLNNSGHFSWVKEIASFSRAHVLRHSRLLSGGSRGRRRCAQCSMELNTALPETCVTRAIVDNTRSIAVRCLCAETELRLRPSEPAVNLLVVDTEGFDFRVLAQYPFARLRTYRVIFEAIHLQQWEFVAAAELLHKHGFAHVSGGYRGNSVWHHRNAPSFDIRRE